jgi:hypothetical protein
VQFAGESGSLTFAQPVRNQGFAPGRVARSFAILLLLAAVAGQLNVYCDQPGQMDRLYADLHRSVLDVFNEFGVQIMTPAYVADPAEPKVVPREQWFANPAEAAAPLKISRNAGGESRNREPEP